MVYGARLESVCSVKATQSSNLCLSAILRSFMFTNFLFVGLGGFIGAVLRYFFYLSFNNVSFKHGFPYGTFFVNALGSFLIGLLLAACIKFNFIDKNSLSSLLIITGILGAFTTFSAFSSDNLVFFLDKNYSMLVLNIFLNNFVGFALVFFGYFSFIKIINTLNN